MQEPAPRSETLSSAGHRLGQIVGDWWELEVVLPLLQELAQELALFADNRSVHRTCRQEKLIWQDADGNTVDYDFVLELNGSASKRGIPVAFLECFWRRGARHSKDKARDDTTKLLPMRDTYPTARYLGIAACGEFTEPAKEFVRTRNIELFFVAKEAIITAFERSSIGIDYPDSLSESKKAPLVAEVERKLTPAIRQSVAIELRKVLGAAAMEAFKSRMRGLISATPQSFKIWEVSRSQPKFFGSLHEATAFLSAPSPRFQPQRTPCAIEYQATYSDGSTFFRSYASVAAALADHQRLESVADHMNRKLSR